MKIQLISDLHLERYPDYMPEVAPGADVLVLAGDIGSYQRGSLLQSEDFGLSRFSPRGIGSKWSRVLYVPGNHEFDGLEFTPTYSRLKELCRELKIEWLEQEVVAIGDVRFIGTTLWSDFDALAQMESAGAAKNAAREKAFRAANFYLSRNTALDGGAPMLAERIREKSIDCQRWLARALSEDFAGRTVVVSHFAPSLRSADPRYGVTPGTAGFCNSIDALALEADFWMHGHLHCFNDYVLEGTVDGKERRTRVLSNPRGYASKGEQKSFREAFSIEL